MKRLSLTLFCCFLAAMTALAQFDSAPAFPGAEGYGRYTAGGRGGTVVHVTNLNDSGEGSFREAVTGGSNRIIVFDVAGVIELQSDIKMKDNLTILGQTAPGDGITLRYYTVQPGGNNIIRFIRFRRGQERNVDDGADATWQRQKSNIILDHCSFSWSIDEVASYYDNKDFTMQWCTIGEPLKYSGHKKGPHGYGGIWGGKGASFHHNLLIHLDNRAPRLNGARFFWKGPNGTEYPNVESCIAAEKVDFRNCVIYNTGTGNGAYGGMGGNHNIVNNYYKAGPATKNKKRVFQCSVSNTSDGTGTKDVNYPGGIWGKFYISGNYVTDAGSSAANYDWSGVTIDKCKDAGVTTPTKDELKIPEVEKGSITTHAAEVAYEKVLSYAGASKSRDCIDTRYEREVRSNEPECIGSAISYEDDDGTHSLSSSDHPKGIIDITADALLPHGGVYTLSAGTPILDTDNDGIPDDWENAHGLNPNTNDANLYTIDNISNGGKGYYTNIEVYANSLVEDIMKNENKDALSSFNEYYPLDDDPSALLPTTISATPESVSITGTASATVTLSSDNTEGAYSISSNPNSAVATASISGNTVTITGVAAGTTSFTVSQAESSTHEAATKTINIIVTAAQGGGDTPATNGELIWNFNSLSTGDIPTGQDFNITATDGKTVMVYVPGSGTASRINASSSITGFTNALYMGGNGSTSSRYLKIPVTGTGILEITAISNTSGATDNFTIYDGSASGKKLKENFTQGNNNIASSGEITVTNSIMLVCTTKTWYYQIHWIPSTPQPTSVIVSPANKTIEVDGTLQLYAQVLPAGADQSVTWRSSDETIAEVDATGKVTAKATGTIKITATATTANRVNDYCMVTVVEKQSGTSGNAIAWDFTTETAQTLTEGGTYTFTANDGSTTLTYKAGNGDKIEGTPSYLRENGGTNSAGIRGIFLNVQGKGTLSIYCKDTNRGVYECYNGSASGTKLADYTAYIGNEDPNYTSTMNVTDANGLFIKTTTKGYIYKITWTPITAPTTQYITKHISSTGWASFVPEKSVVVPDDVDVYYVKSNSYNSTDKTVTAVKIPAGTVIKGDGTNTYGYIVNAEAEGDYQFEVSATEGQIFSENILACGKNNTIPDNSLVFAYADRKSGFYALDNYDIKLPVGIVYLPADVLGTTVGGAPRAVTINFDEATVISNPITKQFNNSFFNLSGQKVDANYKGIIIRNGRKYINK